jgi:hypothetical protein
MDVHKPKNKLVNAKLIIFGAWMSHGKIQIHKIHHGLDLGEATTFSPYTIFCAWTWDRHSNVILSRDSQIGVSNFPKLGFSQL